MKLLLVEESWLFTCMFLSDSILRGHLDVPFIKFCLFLAYDLFIYYIIIVYVAEVDVFTQCYIVFIHIIPLSLIITLKVNTFNL